MNVLTNAAKTAAYEEVLHLQHSIRVMQVLNGYPEPLRKYMWRQFVSTTLRETEPVKAAALLMGAHRTLEALGLRHDYESWREQEGFSATPTPWKRLSVDEQQKLIIAAAEDAHSRPTSAA